MDTIAEYGIRYQDNVHDKLYQYRHKNTQKIMQ